MIQCLITVTGALIWIALLLITIGVCLTWILVLIKDFIDWKNRRVDFKSFKVAINRFYIFLGTMIGFLIGAITTMLIISIEHQLY